VSKLARDLDRYYYIMGQPGLWARLRTILMTPGIWSIIDYRCGRWLFEHRHWYWPRLFSFVRQPWVLWLELSTGIRLPATAEIGPGLYIGHHGGIILNGRCRIGANCNLSQDVTIGLGGRGEKRGVPVIGDRVYLGPGSRIFGKIRIGDDVAIGANAVVGIDLEERSVAGGVPAQIVNRHGSGDYVHFRGEDPSGD
jgi:serine O-acetyltransferase